MIEINKRNITIILFLWVYTVLFSLNMIVTQLLIDGILKFPNPILIMFYFDIEHNAPTVFSSLILGVNSLLLFNIYKKGKEKKWAVLSAIFFYLMIDESMKIHENIHFDSISNASSYLYFSWVIAGLSFVSIIGIMYLKSVLKLRKDIRNGFFISFFLFIFAAIGLDSLGAHFYIENGKVFGANYRYLVALEESLEMLSMIYFMFNLFNLYELTVKVEK